MQGLETTDDYIKRFNEGYLIKKHMPALAEKLKTAIFNSDKATGFQDGIKQYDHEVRMSRYPTWLQDRQQKSRFNDVDKNKDLNEPTIEDL